MLSSYCPLAAWLRDQQQSTLPACILFVRLLPGGADSHNGAPPAQRRQSKPRSGFSGCRCSHKRAALFYLCTFSQQYLLFATCLCELYSLCAALFCTLTFPPATCHRGA